MDLLPINDAIGAVTGYRTVVVKLPVGFWDQWETGESVAAVSEHLGKYLERRLGRKERRDDVDDDDDDDDDGGILWFCCRFHPRSRGREGFGMNE